MLPATAPGWWAMGPWPSADDGRPEVFMNPSEMVDPKDQQLLLELARHAIQTTIQKGRRLPAVESLSPLLREKRGTFVTLWEDQLRGCIGFPYPVKPLAEAVQEAAVSAALQDPRFPPVRLEELPHLEI